MDAIISFLTESITKENFATGTVSGAAAGVIVSILLWIKGRIDLWIDRRKEIKRLRDIIEDYRGRIYTAEVFSFMGEEYAVDVVRRMGFDTMARELYSTLDNASPNLTYDEKEGIRDPLFVYTDRYREVLPPGEKDRVFLINTEGYDGIFKKLEELKWLKLSRRTE